MEFLGALTEDNRLAGNANADVGIRDSQNATVRNNTFGAGTFLGTDYRVRANNGIYASESGTRTRLHDTDIIANIMNGQDVGGCELSEVDCSGRSGYTP